MRTSRRVLQISAFAVQAPELTPALAWEERSQVGKPGQSLDIDVDRTTVPLEGKSHHPLPLSERNNLVFHGTSLDRIEELPVSD